MCKVISLVNQKGGVSKTTSTINIGVGLVNKGYRVLIIDNDPQGSATASLIVKDPDEIYPTLQEVYRSVIEDFTDYPREEIFIHHEEGVNLIPSNIELSGVELALVSTMNREMVLKNYIESIKSEYDYILIDCSPSLGLLTINALAAADSVIIPVHASYLSLKGLEQLLCTVYKVRKYLNRNLKIDGILISMVDKRTRAAREIIEFIFDHFGKKEHVFETMIPFSVRAVESSAMGKSIYAYESDGKLSKAYRNLVEEVASL